MQNIPDLDRKGLREFALVTGTIIAVLFGLFFPWLLEKPLPIWPWLILGILTLLGLFTPLALQPVYRIWMKFGLLISRVTTPVILGSVFFLVLTPIGLVMRLTGHDPMSRKIDNEIESYRVSSHKQQASSMEKPF
jgi:hypothetical protein